MCVFKNEINNETHLCNFYNTGVFSKETPLDDLGFCLFHSSNISWKTEHNFNSHLQKVIEYYEADPASNQIMLEDIVFIQGAGTLFSGKTFKKNIKLNRCVFTKDFTIEDSSFKNIDFSLCVFNSYFTLIYSSINGLILDDAYFKAKLTIKKVSFYHDFFMLNTRFDSGMSLMQLVFFSKCFFQNFKTNLDTNISCGIVFKDIDFKGFTTFERSEFNSLTEFNQIKVWDSLFFHKTQFNYNEPVPMSYSLSFKKLDIKQEARVEFRGAPDNKMFNKVQDVNLNYHKIEGSILFEYSDLTKFDAFTREGLISATKQKNAKVFIGVGCIKYYNQTPIKTILFGIKNQNLISELCNTFADYFTKNEGFNLGVQIVSKTETEVTFFYFSDEVITFEEFEAQLQKGEQNMWQLIKIEDDHLKAQPPRNNLPSKVIYATDTMVNLMSLVLKIGSRIPLGLISKHEVLHLVNSTLPMNKLNSNSIVYNQIMLFGINNSQLIQVNKIK